MGIGGPAGSRLADEGEDGEGAACPESGAVRSRHGETDRGGEKGVADISVQKSGGSFAF